MYVLLAKTKDNRWYIRNKTGWLGVFEHKLANYNDVILMRYMHEVREECRNTSFNEDSLWYYNTETDIITSL